jgi:hypothetical protein
MDPMTLVDPYPMMTEFPGDWSMEYPEHWIEDDGGPPCVCEGGLGWLPCPDGTFIECHLCRVQRPS